MNVAEWLEGMGLGVYAPAFEENAIDVDTLVELDAADLKELGVDKLGHRKKILAAIANLSLPGARARVLGTPTSMADQAGQRRQVTVLFADLTGYTETQQPT